MGGLFSRPAPPARDATDSIVPMAWCDDHSTLRTAVVDISLRFDDPLDTARLRAALDELLTKNGWHKLGARLRLNGKGRIDFHIPQAYSDERPGYIFTEMCYDTSINEHPLGSKLPKAVASDKPLLLGDVEAFRSITRAADSPNFTSEWLERDIPAVIYHAACFRDATLFTITWPHVLMDAMGLSSLLSALSQILNGRSDDVPDFLGAEGDPLKGLGVDANPKDYVYSSMILKPLQLIRLGLSLAFDDWFGPKSSQRGIFVPAAYFQPLYEKVRMELKENGAEDSFVSESDVLIAWWFRTLITAMKPKKNNAPVMALNVFDFRHLVPDMLAEKGAYVANATFAIFTLLSVSQLRTSSISSLAQTFRRSLNEQRNRPQLEAMAAVNRIAFAKGMSAMVGKPDMYLIALSNWHRGKLFQVDFFGALAEGKGVSTDDPRRGKPSYIHPYGTMRGMQLKNLGAVRGKDADGNWWLNWSIYDECWPAIEKLLQDEKMLGPGPLS